VGKQYSYLFLALDSNADEHLAGCTVSMSISMLISSSRSISVPVERAGAGHCGEGKAILLMRPSIGNIWLRRMLQDER
jgi:hypothetical protein